MIMEEKMKTKYFIIGGAGLIIIALAIFAVLNINKAQAYSTIQSTYTLGNTVGNTASNTNGQIQEVRLYMKNYNYATEPAILKKGIPVRMTADLNTVVGCARDVVIKDFGVRKYVKTGDNIIEFTPTKTGTIGIACSMNMYHGSFTVIDESNPNAPAEITAAPVSNTPAGSCGANGGGCGCGARNI
nr:hypothetical protein [uncultured archaeon]AQS35000.1 hypothetical protein [uncultured archaeon]